MMIYKHASANKSKLISGIMLILIWSCMIPCMQITAAEPYEASQLKVYIDQTAAYQTAALQSDSSAVSYGEWTILGLARAGMLPDSVKQSYLSSLKEKLVDCDGILSKNRYTEYSRVILALSALDVDAGTVYGYPLLINLSDYDKVSGQGINGVVYALLALDSRQYEIPVLSDSSATQTERQKLIDYLTSAQLSDGGWNLTGGSADTDMTAMVLTALAPYRQQAAVETSISRGLARLSSMQLADGGFASSGTENAESTAQVLTALAALGISVSDASFVKNEHNILDALLSFQKENGAFSHTAGGNENGMATDQSFYALVAYYRYLNNQTPLYDMTDIKTDSDGDNAVYLPTMTRQRFLERCAAITETPLLDEKQEVLLLLAEAEQQGSFQEKESIIKKLTNAKQYLLNLEQTLQSLDQDIWNQIDPLRLSQKDSETVEKLKERYDIIPEGDRTHLSYESDLLDAVSVMEKLANSILPKRIFENMKATGETFAFTGTISKKISYQISIKAADITEEKEMNASVIKKTVDGTLIPKGAKAFSFSEEGSLPAACKITVSGLLSDGNYKLYQLNGKESTYLKKVTVKNGTVSFKTQTGGTFYFVKIKDSASKTTTADKKTAADHSSSAVTEQQTQENVTVQITENTDTPNDTSEKTQQDSAVKSQRNTAAKTTQTRKASTGSAETEKNSTGSVTKKSTSETQAANAANTEKSEETTQSQSNNAYITKEELEAIKGKNTNIELTGNYQSNNDSNVSDNASAAGTYNYKIVINGTDVTVPRDTEISVKYDVDWQEAVNEIAEQPFCFALSPKELPGRLYLETETDFADGAYLLCSYYIEQSEASFMKKVFVENGILCTTLDEGGTYFLTTKLKLETQNTEENDLQQSDGSNPSENTESVWALGRELIAENIPIVVIIFFLIVLAGFGVIVWVKSIKNK